MFAICMRYCANYEDARDLLHDGFMTVFTKIEKFQNTGSFEGWVRRIFVNHAVEWYRSRAKVSMVGYVAENDKCFVEIEPESDDETGVFGLTEVEILAMVEELPQQYKIVFNLYAIEGLSHREISEKLGISEGTSRSNLLRARNIMQKQVKDRIKVDLRYSATK